MKPIISETVYKKIYTLLQKFKSPESKKLGEELLKANIVKDDELQNNVVSLNSTVEFMDETMSKPIQLKIVLPEDVDLSKRKISIMAPISIALIGFKESYKFDWEMPSGTRNLKIVRVIN